MHFYGAYLQQVQLLVTREGALRVCELFVAAAQLFNNVESDGNRRAAMQRVSFK